MGARSGNNYLSTLKKLDAAIWLGGERVKDVTAHPAFVNCARSVASLYDMQLEHVEQMTYRTEDGGRAGYSFIQPKSADDVGRRARMMKAWAEWGCGMLGRSPDYLNAGIAAMAAAHEFFALSDPRFGANIVKYYRAARDHDWCAAHALENAHASRALESAGRADANLALRMVDRSADGIIVTGCRMLATLAPLAEELLVFPPAALKAEPASAPFALSFAIPCNAKGLRFYCRDAYDLGRSRFDHPLTSRFDEMDCAAVFDNVLVPWERVFLCGDVERSNAMWDATGARVHMMHQVVVRNAAKSEFLLGLAARIARSGDAMGLKDVREGLAEMIAVTEAMRACLRAAEADAAPDRWGVYVPARAPLGAARNLFARMYPRMVEIIREASASSLMATPAEADFANPDKHGDIERYFTVAGSDSRERAALYRLAWDATCSAFAGRQMLLERDVSGVSGDSIPMASALVDDTDLKPLMERVDAFLSRPD
ncbi:MAG TPA: 4-hydroxyphenylacetate 3-monooxygenase, oxygenase component [Candidatus Binataceae bacterium]|nr:4-hydroxyphenylacetate 3-monooxygenase, oxygenase component [Candidatus Binataceae bacterium]